MTDYERRVQMFKEEVRKKGLNVSDIARQHGLRPNDVHKVLGGFVKCNRGVGHVVAVKLGLKDGVAP